MVVVGGLASILLFDFLFRLSRTSEQNIPAGLADCTAEPSFTRSLDGFILCGVLVVGQTSKRIRD